MSDLDNTGAGFLVLKFVRSKDMYDVDQFNISRVDGRKESEQGKVKVYIYHSNYLQNYLCGKQKTSDSLPSSRIMGGMQHHIFIVIPVDN